MLALEEVVYLPLNVNEGEGVELSKEYKVGYTYPVFILIDNTGDVIRRWVGYSNARRLISTIQLSLRDLTTVNERKARFKTEPNRSDALALARFHADTHEFLTAVEYYHEAQKLSAGTSANYTYEIFMNTANAAWNEEIPFDDVFPVADTVLQTQGENINNLGNVSRIICRLARKFGRAEETDKYLQSGIEATINSQDKKHQETHKQLLADQALHIHNDTAGAIVNIKTSLGDGWEENREKVYKYAKWCLERKIDLVEAEKYTHWVAQRTERGKYGAKVLSTLAEICELIGKKEEAIRLMEMAVEQDPASEYYPNQLERMQGK